MLYNNAKPSQYLLDRYAKEGEYWVHYDEKKLAESSFTAIGSNMVSSEPSSTQGSGSDPIAATRTFIRHDADVVAKQIMKLYFS